jgi:hypothetical protein
MQYCVFLSVTKINGFFSFLVFLRIVVRAMWASNHRTFGSHPRILRVDFLSLKKLTQPGEFNDLFSGQDGAYQRLLRSGVNLI